MEEFVIFTPSLITDNGGITGSRP